VIRDDLISFVDIHRNTIYCTSAIDEEKVKLSQVNKKGKEKGAHIKEEKEQECTKERRWDSCTSEGDYYPPYSVGVAHPEIMSREEIDDWTHRLSQEELWPQAFPQLSLSTYSHVTDRCAFLMDIVSVPSAKGW
jgi:hypothetical protein